MENRNNFTLLFVLYKSMGIIYINVYDDDELLVFCYSFYYTPFIINLFLLLIIITILYTDSPYYNC